MSLSRNQTTAEPQSLSEIIEWYRGVIEALLEQRAAVLSAIRNGSVVSARFAGMTSADLDTYYDKQRRELDRLTMLNLVASAEAEIRKDFHDRVKRNLKDDLSKAYRAWYDTLSPERKNRPNFDKRGILEEMRKAGVMDKHVIGQFRESLQGRHWIGHGRYFNKPVPEKRLDPMDVYGRANALLQELLQC